MRTGTAAREGVRALLSPGSIAVIGASHNPQAIGGRLFHNVVGSDFAGSIFAVNSKGGDVQGVPAYRSVVDVPGKVDLALIAVPADCVADAARECATKGVKSVVVVSAGFAEVGEQGIALQEELQSICREAGMRLVGPNCMGVVNTAPDVRLNGQFAPVTPLPGRLAVLAQSGALGVALIHEANRMGLGLSSFVSVGNQADVDTADLLEYWENDPATDVILLYLESIHEPPRFAQVARRVARTKPIIAVKSGRSVAGARATSSHTGALLRVSDSTVDALFRQARVVRTDTLAEMFDAAALLADQPVPASNRAAILTNGGGPGILAADAAEAAGLELPTFAPAIRRQLEELLPGAASAANPVDMIASATPEDYARAIALIGADPAIDSLIAISGPPLAIPSNVLAASIREAVAQLPRRLTAATVFMSTDAPREGLKGGGITLPSYAYPENAARALGRAVDYGRLRSAATGRVIEFRDVRPAVADRAIAPIAKTGGEEGWLGPRAVDELLRAYGLPLSDQAIVATPAAAARAAGGFGRSCALKGVSSGVIHKSEAHGVRLNLATPAAVERAAREMAADYSAAGRQIEGFLVQPMAPSGVELLVGAVRDPLFGPVVACAIGGISAELVKDVAVGLTPLTDTDAAQMVRSLAGFPLLDGYRGAQRLDVAALEEVLLRVSAMAEAHPQIDEMDLNPVIVTPRGAVIVDARARVSA